MAVPIWRDFIWNVFFPFTKRQKPWFFEVQKTGEGIDAEEAEEEVKVSWHGK